MRKGPAAGLRATATAEYHRLGTELPGLPVTWSGSLSWTREDSAPDAGPGQTIVDATTVATLEPNLRQPPEWAVWAPGDGTVGHGCERPRPAARSRPPSCAAMHPNGRRRSSAGALPSTKPKRTGSFSRRRAARESRCPTSPPHRPTAGDGPNGSPVTCACALGVGGDPSWPFREAVPRCPYTTSLPIVLC